MREIWQMSVPTCIGNGNGRRGGGISVKYEGAKAWFHQLNRDSWKGVMGTGAASDAL